MENLIHELSIIKKQSYEIDKKITEQMNLLGWKI